MIDTPADELALELAVAHQRRDPFTPIPARWRDLNFAYSVQDRLVSRWREAGEGDIVGWKVGLTSARMQAFAGEIVEDRNADYRSLDAASLIADNSWNMGVVLGVPTSAQRIHALTGRRGVLSVNGEPTDQGMSEDCGGDPLRIVAWLAAHLARRGQPLQPHQWVLTGSIVTTKFPMPGDRFHFALEGLSPVEVQIA